LRSDRCAPCPRGTWGDTTETTVVGDCRDCIAGLYNDVSGSMLGCKNCPAGTYSTTTKNEKDSDCTNCGTGKYSVIEGSNSITSCIEYVLLICYFSCIVFSIRSYHFF
jgi:hypothetical protein